MTKPAHDLSMRGWLVALLTALLSACATMPPGASYPKRESTALAHPEETAIGRKVEPRVVAHLGSSGFRLFASGSDAFAIRMQMANSAQKTLDVQYFIFKDDDTGKLLMNALLRAADRGVRVRILIDDGSSPTPQDDRIGLLTAHSNIAVRLYNPFFYRGSIPAVRYAEFALTAARLNYRMHNKLFIVDNTIAMVGGRNVGDEYFDTGDDVQFGDYDAFTLGPITRSLSKSFDAYWNSALSIPVRALYGPSPDKAKLAKMNDELIAHADGMRNDKLVQAIGTGNPLASLLNSEAGLVWAKAEVLADSPDKSSVEDGDTIGALFRRRLLDAASGVTSELDIVSPYFVPGEKGEALLKRLRERGVRVRVLTNSLLSTDVVAVHAGYRRYRMPLLEAGVELYEVKPSPGQPNPRDGMLKAPSSGQFSLHAKAFVFDRKRVFVGSANFDRRSMHLNTEIGLMIESPELARQIITRFDAIARPSNSFVLALEGNDTASRRLVWNSIRDGQRIVYENEPGDDQQRKLIVDLYGLLPLEELL